MRKLGRRLPTGARFATVAELFDMPTARQQRTFVWCPGPGGEWAPVYRLLTWSTKEATLAWSPSAMVLVVREDPADEVEA